MENHRHLKRLSNVWVNNPRYFITVCTHHRRRILAHLHVADVLHREWVGAWERHGWAIGSYVIMPDHVHFFCTHGEQGKTLSQFIGLWKEWTAKAIKHEIHVNEVVWQKGFFDHLLRSDESYSEKWNYVKNNPVRAGLVEHPDEWPFAGYIHYR